jgi:hypothetical protein
MNHYFLRGGRMNGDPKSWSQMMAQFEGDDRDVFQARERGGDLALECAGLREDFWDADAAKACEACPNAAYADERRFLIQSNRGCNLSYETHEATCICGFVRLRNM